MASGRAYPSIHNMFREVSEKIVYIAENGAHIIYKGKELSVTKMKWDYVEGIIQELRKFYAEGCNTVVSTPGCTLLESTDQEFIDFMKHNYRNNIMLTQDVLGERMDVLKIAVHKKQSIRTLGETQFIPHWSNQVKTCMAGEEWVDFMDASVDKGNALLFLQNYFGITKSETMAFGDNANDIGMLYAAGVSYAVESAREEVKAAANYVCPGYEKKGVYEKLLQLMEEKNDTGI